MVGEAVTSLGVFLSQEIQRFNELIEVMCATLKSLLRAIKGEVVMSAELEVMYNCFVFQTVPPTWTAAGILFLFYFILIFKCFPPFLLTVFLLSFLVII